MPKFNAIKNNFLKGELSPKFFGRTDLDIYLQGAEELKNGKVTSSGGFEKRMGTEFLFSELEYEDGNVEALAGYHKVIPFQVSNGRRFFISMKPGTGVQGAGLTPGLMRVFDDSGVPQPMDYRPAFGAMPNLSLTVCDMFSTIGLGPVDNYMNETTLREMQYLQIGDILYFVHESYWPTWVRFYEDAAGTVTFTFGTILDLPNPPSKGVFDTDEFQRIPYRTTNVESTATFTPVNLGGGIAAGALIELAFSGPVFGDVIFPPYLPTPAISPDTEGNIYKLHSGAVLITGFNIGTGRLEATVLDTITSTAATANWEESAWNVRRGFPKSIAYFQQRLCFFGSFSKPDTFWASQIGDVTELSLGIGAAVAADSPFNLGASSPRIQKGQWISAGQTLFMGTNEIEYELFAADPSSALSALNVDLRIQTNHGAAPNVQALRTGSALYFADKAGNRVRELVFDDNEKVHRARNLNAFSDHVIDRSAPLRVDDLGITPTNYPLRDPVQIEDMLHQSSENLIWVLDNYKGLSTYSTDREVGVDGFTYQRIAGDLDDNGGPKIHSVGLVQVSSGDNIVGEELWLTVERTIDGSDVTYIEKIRPQFSQDILNPPYSTAQSDITDDLPVFVDSAFIQAQSAATTTVTGLTHLEGQLVQILADGLFVGTETVTSGEVTLESAAQVVIVGLGYEAKIKTLRLDNGSAIGSSQRALKRVDEIMLRFFESVGAKVGTDENDLLEISFIEPDQIPEDPLSLFTGDKLQKPLDTWNRDSQFIIKNDQPFPFHVVAIVFRGTTND